MRIQAQKLKHQLDKQQGLDEDKDFKASKGWLSRFKKLYGIKMITVSGEGRSSDAKAAEEYPAKLKAMIEEGGYCPEQIYNCDETGLCYKMVPNQTLAIKSVENKAKGFKLMKDRVTFLFCVNQTGNHKLKPLCIGKSRSPRCFHHKNMKNLAFDYKSSKNSWMTGEIFEDWFQKTFVPLVRTHLKRQNLDTKAMLLLDNCPAHPPTDFLINKDGKIKVSFLPKNTTSEIQPLYQGIISNLKMNYRKNLIMWIVDEECEITESIKKMTLHTMFDLGEKAWNSISPSTIQKCWNRRLPGTFA